MLAKDSKVYIYTDSKYAFDTFHVHGAMHKERGVLTAGEKEIKKKKEIYISVSFYQNNNNNKNYREDRKENNKLMK